MGCDCRTVKLIVYVTTDDFDKSMDVAREVSRTIRRNDEEAWITSAYNGPVDRIGCLHGDCDRGKVKS